jgi:hypothetical protein
MTDSEFNLAMNDLHAMALEGEALLEDAPETACFEAGTMAFMRITASACCLMARILHDMSPKTPATPIVMGFRKEDA